MKYAILSCRHLRDAENIELLVLDFVFRFVLMKETAR